MTRANFGDVANLGFVVGARCVAVIDTGGTFAVGRALRRAIQRVATVPVCYVINTHVHPDHVFGNAAFTDDHPQFIGHVRLADAMRRRGPNYLNALQRDLGEAGQQSAIVLPTRSVATTEELDLGGRILSLRAWPTAHTDTDLTVFDESSRTLWLGDLLFVGHVPVLDGNLRGFLAAIDRSSRLSARTSPFPGTAAHSPGRKRLRRKSATSTGSWPMCVRRSRESARLRRPWRPSTAAASNGCCSTIFTGATSPRPTQSSSGTNERQGVYCQHCRPASEWRESRG